MSAVVMFSGGAGSYLAAKRAVERWGADAVTLLFCDVQGASGDDPHIGEDPTTYDFIYAAAARLDAPLVVLNEGRTIWQVFRDKRWLGNSRLAQCSHVLKQEPAHKWLAVNDPDEKSTVVVGIDWSESHRLPAVERAYTPRQVWAPMTEAPYLSKGQMVRACNNDGLPALRLYDLGFAHNNCGGGCVKAGQAHFALLLDTMPERYARWEQEEQSLRDHLGKDVSILRDRSGGESAPLTLREFRERMTSDGTQLDLFDMGGCGCFVDEANS